MKPRSRKPKKTQPRARQAVKSRRSKETPKRSRTHCKPGCDCDPPMPGQGIPEKCRATLEALATVTHSKKRAAILDTLPPDFWKWGMETYGAIGLMSAGLSIAPMTIRKYLRAYRIVYDTSPTPPRYRRFFGRCNRLCEKIESNRLPTDHNYLILACLHIPTISELWFERAMAVAEAEECDGLIVVGDLVNADALGRYAMKQRGVMVRFQDELDCADEFMGQMAETFSRIYLLTGNHEMRLVERLQHEVDACKTFDALFQVGKWYEGEEMHLGRDLILAHTRGRKVLSSASNEHSLAEECDYLIGGPHRYFQGFSQSGRRIGYIGGLFDRERIWYYNNQATYAKWHNGFWVYKQGGVLLGFAEERGKGFVDWSRYGCK